MNPVGDRGGPVRGTRVATAPGHERYAEFTVPEGRYVYVIVPRSRSGVEGEPIDGIEGELVVSGREGITPPPAPTRAGVGPVDLSQAARAIFEPPRFSDHPHKMQVIEGGASPDQGKLIAEIDVAPGGPMVPDAARQATAPNILEGSTYPDMATTRKLWLRTISAHGRPGGSISRTVPIVDRPNHHAILIGSIVGGTPTGISAPTATDAWELDASDGVRLRALDPVSGFPAGWTGSSGALSLQNSAAPYMQKATLEFDEKDLGAAIEFVLELYDEAQRKTSVSPVWATTLGDSMMVPSAPAYDLDGREEHPSEGPWWMARQITGEGKAIHPLRRMRWRYVAGNSTPVSHTELDYQDYIPGEILKARYVRVRLDLEEPTGWHQLISPRVFAIARALMIRRTGTATPEASVTAPPGSRFTDTSAGKDYVKTSGLGNTGWQEAGAAGTSSESKEKYLHAQGGGGARYYPAGIRTYTAFGTITPTLLRAWAFPLVLGTARTMDALSCYVTSAAAAGGIARLGVYANRGAAYTEPDVQLYTSGDIATTASNALVTASPALTLGPGLFWLVVCFAVNAPTIRGLASGVQIQSAMDAVLGIDATLNTSGVGWRQDLGSVALPSPWGTGTTIVVPADAAAPIIAARFSA